LRFALGRLDQRNNLLGCLRLGSFHIAVGVEFYASVPSEPGVQPRTYDGSNNRRCDLSKRDYKLANITAPCTRRVHDHEWCSRIDPLITQSTPHPLDLRLGLGREERRIIGGLNKPNFDFGLAYHVVFGERILHCPVGSYRSLDLCPLLWRQCGHPLPLARARGYRTTVSDKSTNTPRPVWDAANGLLKRRGDQKLVKALKAYSDGKLQILTLIDGLGAAVGGLASSTSGVSRKLRHLLEQASKRTAAVSARKALSLPQ
jgi:hypothetical protein